MKKTLILFLMCVVLMVIMTSCAPYELSKGHQESGIIAGFWHGIILPFSVLGKLLGIEIGLFNIRNEGFPYWLGYWFALVFYATAFKIYGKVEMKYSN